MTFEKLSKGRAVPLLLTVFSAVAIPAQLTRVFICPNLSFPNKILAVISSEFVT